ncbi:MAG TPA: VOC family protein [Anaerolineales bacterium]|nr:VOC family protein [Anaerolineales bacterium]
MASRIAVVALWAEDVPTATHFYRDVIGLPLAPHHSERPHFDVAGTTLTILPGRPIPPEQPAPARFPTVAFAVDDLDRAVARLQARHVELPWGIEADSTSRWVMFRDPAGNLVELVGFS